jgi:hypothetical protein
LNDADIRVALRSTLKSEGYRYVEELYLYGGASRADMVVIGDTLTGIEVKSPKDTLTRLPMQALLYEMIFDHCVLVADPKKLAKAAETLNPWWGLASVEVGEGGLTIKTTREATPNLNKVPLHVAELLWKPEMKAELQALGVAKGLSKPKVALAQWLTSLIPKEDLTRRVCARLQARKSWLFKRS